MSARDTILAKLRTARKDDRNGPMPVPDVAGYYDPLQTDSTPDQLIARFSANLTNAHAEVLLADQSSWPILLASKLREMKVRTIAIAKNSAEAGRLIDASSGLLTPHFFDRAIEDWKTELLDDVEAGFTVADSAFASPGALILKSSPYMPRTLSLIPPLHIALVRAGTIHPDLYTAAMREGWSRGLPSNLIMISGPSKTSDIQQTLAYGAHGPKQLLVVIVR